MPFPLFAPRLARKRKGGDTALRCLRQGRLMDALEGALDQAIGHEPIVWQELRVSQFSRFVEDHRKSVQIAPRPSMSL